MMDTIYCCGFNGFSQISQFYSFSPGHQHESVQKELLTQDKYQCPLKVCELPHGKRLQNVHFTWDRIAATFSFNGDTSQTKCRTSTYVFGFSPSSQKTEPFEPEDKCKIYLKKAALASTETDILLVDDGDMSQRELLQGGKDEALHCSIHTDSGASPDVHYVGGGHKEFFAVYDKIGFGKLVPPHDRSSKESSAGLNETENHPPQLLLQLQHIDSCVEVCALSCGKEHVLLLSKHGTVYSYGLGSRGQLGHGTVESEPSPRLIEGLEGIPIKCIASGGWHSTAVSNDGDLYAWGWNESGQLGLTSFSKETGVHRKHPVSQEEESVGVQAEPTVTDIPLELNIESVACGSRHTLCLTDGGRVLSCGWNGYGQLGHGHLTSIDKFTLIDQLHTIVNIFAGQWNSVFVSNSNKV